MDLNDAEVETLTDLITLLAEEIKAVNVANGWFEDDRTFGDEIALIHSEVSEMFEAYRDQGFDTRLRFQSEDGYSLLPPDDPNARRWLDGGAVPKPEGVGPEAADVLIRLLDTCLRHDIDVIGEAVRKIKYNATRGYRHGGKAI